ncbi:hypothetical protein ACQ86N_02540 [Puia sp. P3]|uniref:hypothetical protein n=1 Tax=Puia sp. P3 TaxID=3423952 RepID=UPI003D6689A4
MIKQILIIALFCVCMSAVKAQHAITYTFDKAVVDTLLGGINWYEKMYHKPVKDLKIYAILVERDGDIEIYLQEYSPIQLPGLLDVIKNSSRWIKISDDLLIPLVFPADVHSKQLQQDKIAILPYSGYYVKITYERLKLKSIETRILF